MERHFSLKKMNTLLTPGGHQNNTRQQNSGTCTKSSHTYTGVLCHLHLIGPPSLTEKANLPMSAFLYSKCPLISSCVELIFPFSLCPTQVFFFNIYCIYSTGLLGHAISYSLIGSLCALSSTCSCHRYGFSYPSHHHCCPKTKRKLPKPTSREFRGITFYCITFLFFFLLNLHVSAYIINQMHSLR